MAKDQAYRDVLSRNLAALIRESGQTQVQVANATGISPSALSSYVQGVRYPRPEYVTALANHFGVPPGSLTEDSTAKSQLVCSLSNEAIRVAKMFDELDEISQKLVKIMVQLEYDRKG